MDIKIQVRESFHHVFLERERIILTQPDGSEIEYEVTQPDCGDGYIMVKRITPWE